MIEMHCSRCSRPRLPNELEDIGQLVGHLPHSEQPDESLLGDSGPWASLDGLDVCPQCQTPQEQRGLARDVVAMIEAEITRTRDENTDPTPHEAALIAYAMFLRERLEALSSPPPPPPPRGDETSTCSRARRRARCVSRNRIPRGTHRGVSHWAPAASSNRGVQPTPERSHARTRALGRPRVVH